MHGHPFGHGGRSDELPVLRRQGAPHFLSHTKAQLLEEVSCGGERSSATTTTHRRSWMRCRTRRLCPRLARAPPLDRRISSVHGCPFSFPFGHRREERQASRTVPPRGSPSSPTPRRNYWSRSCAGESSPRPLLPRAAGAGYAAGLGGCALDWPVHLPPGRRISPVQCRTFLSPLGTGGRSDELPVLCHPRAPHLQNQLLLPSSSSSTRRRRHSPASSCCCFPSRHLPLGGGGAPLPIVVVAVAASSSSTRRR